METPKGEKKKIVSLVYYGPHPETEDIYEEHLNIYESVVFYVYCKRQFLSRDDYFVALVEDYHLGDLPLDKVPPTDLRNYDAWYKFKKDNDGRVYKKTDNRVLPILTVPPKRAVLNEKQLYQAVLDLSKKLPQNMSQIDELSRAKIYCIVRSIMSEFFNEMFGFGIHRFSQILYLLDMHIRNNYKVYMAGVQIKYDQLKKEKEAKPPAPKNGTKKKGLNVCYPLSPPQNPALVPLTEDEERQHLEQDREDRERIEAEEAVQFANMLYK